MLLERSVAALHTRASCSARHPCHPTTPRQATYELLESAVAALPPGPQHLVVLSGVPLVFPKVRPGG